MEPVELALPADRVHQLQARIVVRESDLDLGAGRGIAVEQRLDLDNVIGLHRLLGARLLIDEQDAHVARYPFDSISLLQAPVGDLEPAREPHVNILRVADELIQIRWGRPHAGCMLTELGEPYRLPIR
jgi:hypothetical protein